MEMKLDAKFYRTSNMTADISPCKDKHDNCIGGTIGGNESCKIGLKGLNCEVCDLENERGQGQWAPSGEFQCSDCSTVENNA